MARENQKASYNNKIWVGYSAASSHMTYNEKSLFDIQEITDKVKIGDGNKLIATKTGIK